MGLLDGIVNLATIPLQAHANKKADERANQYAREAQSRANAENVKFWNMQNDYNSPNAQMTRLKNAGLNPNLVYGTGATTLASGMPQSKAAETRSTSNAAPFAQAASTIGQSLQNDNLRTQNTVMKQEAALKAAQTANEGIKGKHGQLNYEIAEALKQTSLEAAQKNLELLNANVDTRWSESVIKGNEALISNQTIQARVNKIKTDAAVAAENLSGQKLKNALLQYEANLNDMYMNQKDPRVKAALMFLEKLTSKAFK